MFYKTKNNLLKIKEKYWAQEKDYRTRLNKLQEEEDALKKKVKMPSASKLFIIFLFLNCTAVEIFTCWSITRMLSISYINGSSIDFTPLVALISTVVAEVIGYAVYSLKSMKENTKNGIIYDIALKNIDNTPSKSGEDCIG